MGIPAVIPAAGLGTRLAPWTDDCAKELLPVGGRPMIWGALSECRAAGVPEVAVVLRPDKAALRAWIEALVDFGPTVRVVEQPEPVGVLDAIDRGRRALGADRVVGVQPDWVHLPDQSGLRQLLEAAQTAEGSWFGLFSRTPERAARMGVTGRVELSGEATAAGARRHRIAKLLPGAADSVGALHTGFGEVHGPPWIEAVARGPLADRRTLELLNGLAADGLLHGVEIDGQLLDLGVAPGYADAKRRFGVGAGTWNTPNGA